MREKSGKLFPDFFYFAESPLRFGTESAYCPLVIKN